MSRNSEQEGNTRDRQLRDTRQLLLSMADTTWRMFLAPALLVPIGIVGDLKYHTKPWLTIVSAVAGLGVSVMLVRQQLRGGQ